jgi:hypothetical protein
MTNSAWKWIGCGAICGVLLAAAPAAAQEQKPMSPEEKAAMEAWTRSMTPGPQHAELAKRAGSWSFQGTFWQAPGAPPTMSNGTAERTAILGGRIIQEKVVSTYFNAPFEGMGYTGYDNSLGKYWSTWFDNMSTSLMTSTGTCDKGRCTFEAKNTDPMTGKVVTARWVSVEQADKETHSMYGPGPDGKEFKMMELVYTRKRSSPAGS